MIHDMSGWERYESLISLYYDVVDGAIIVYDVNFPRSNERVLHWLQKLPPNVPYEIVGNKNDSDDGGKNTMSCKYQIRVEDPLRKLLQRLPPKEEREAAPTFLVYFWDAISYMVGW